MKRIRRYPMAKDRSIHVKDAVYKLQLFLLEGIHNENQLFSAGSLMSRSDYEDVVTERSIANLCGYPLCKNSLPSERPRKGRYRISLKEHKVYDLHETYMYCSSDCVVNSRAFAATLQEERCSVMNPAKIDDILRLFGDSSMESNLALGENGDLGFSNLKIQENVDANSGEVSLQEWIGPSNAIEGYIPQRDHTYKSSLAKNRKKESKSSHINGEELLINEMNFTSAIMTEDEYSSSKISGPAKTVSNAKLKELKGKTFKKNEIGNQLTILENVSVSEQSDPKRKLRVSKGDRSEIVAKDDLGVTGASSCLCQSSSNLNSAEANKKTHAEKVVQSSKTMPKSSLKTSGVRKQTRSVTWADEKIDSMDGRNTCKVQEVDASEEGTEELNRRNGADEDSSLRFESAESCAMALSQAANAVALGESEVTDAISEAGIIILPHPHSGEEGECQKGTDVLEPEPTPLKWPRKLGISHSDLLDSEDSWYDTPPEGFSLTLSPFATMFMALFAWITSSSLAYIYGRDEISHEDFLSVNGREYPRKIVLTDGRSSEIKQTFAGCLARALPGLVSDLRLPVPVSNLEQGLGHLLDTMSFTDALPSFRLKQWQVINLLFLDALSVYRISTLTPHMTSRRLLLHKVLDGAQISAEEYELMKDLIIPLGRVPHFSSQSGG